MHRVDSSHGAVVLGMLPLATAIAGFLRAHERPSAGFWLASVVGSGTVIGFALAAGDGSFRSADLALLASVVLTAMGYAEGGRLSREMGGWQVICWAVVLGVPFLVPSVAWLIWRHGLEATPASWAGFAYVSLVSAFLGFFAWYRGLATGGVARVGQLQLLQPFFTLAFAATFLGERFGLGAVLAATLVALSIFISRKTRITLTTPDPAGSAESRKVTRVS
jgi:drug/metabolite transporter (DMT)-like permease